MVDQFAINAGTGRNYLALGALILGGALFAGSSFLVAFSNMGADAAGVWRMAFSLMPLLLWLLFSPARVELPKHWPGILLAGGFLALDLILWHRSIHWIGPGFAAVLTNFMVFFMMGFGILLFGERASVRLALIAVLAFGAAVVIISPEAGNRSFGLWGGIFGILSGLAYALSLVVMKLVEKRRNELHQPPGDLRVEMLLFSSGALAVMLLASLFSGNDLAIPDLREAGLMIGYGIGVQFIGWLLIVYGTRKIDTTLAGLILLIEPVLALLLNDSLGFGAPSLLQYMAAAIVLGCVASGIYLRS